MKWRKLLLFLAGSSAALGCLAYFWSASLRADHLAGLGLPLPARLFAAWAGLPLPAGTLDLATWWTICAAVVIDILYLVWLRHCRRVRYRHALGGVALAQRHCLSADAYAEALRQRHDALLARYQDPGLVQFLLNREAARAQHIAQWFEVNDELSVTAKRATTARAKQGEPEIQRRVEQPALPMMVNPLGI